LKIINKIVIIGGGSAAWLSAAYLAHNTDIEIAIIDKEVSASVGVGEATLIDFHKFMTSCGITIDDWFPALDATFKCGICYPDWLKQGNTIWHPFDIERTFQGYALNNLWADNQEYNYREYGVPGYHSNVLHNKFDGNLETTAFHIDAGKLVTFLEEILLKKYSLITSIKSEVIKVNKNELGVTSVVLKNGNTIQGDLFIDCTGFASLLNPNRKTQSLAKTIFTDTAIAYPVKYKDRHNEMHPYTRAHAVEHGWVWTTPVRTRLGSGLVFNRSITDVDTAKDFFVNYWGKDRVERDKIRVIDWTPYYNPAPWDKNIISIGLSAGFIEPLESTGLGITTLQITWLVDFIKNRLWSQADASAYNTLFNNQFTECADFVSFHYAKTQEKTGLFWEYVQQTFKHSDKQLAFLELSKQGILQNFYNKTQDMFGAGSWNIWIAQLEFPIGPSRNKIPKHISEQFLLRWYNTAEKYRINNAKHHATEIERLEHYYGLDSI
jgi:tryptophan halogenase